VQPFRIGSVVSFYEADPPESKMLSFDEDKLFALVDAKKADLEHQCRELGLLDAQARAGAASRGKFKKLNNSAGCRTRKDLLQLLLKHFGRNNDAIIDQHVSASAGSSPRAMRRSLASLQLQPAQLCDLAEYVCENLKSPYKWLKVLISLRCVCKDWHAGLASALVDAYSNADIRGIYPEKFQIPLVVFLCRAAMPIRNLKLTLYRGEWALWESMLRHCDLSGLEEIDIEILPGENPKFTYNRRFDMTVAYSHIAGQNSHAFIREAFSLVGIDLDQGILPARGTGILSRLQDISAGGLLWIRSLTVRNKDPHFVVNSYVLSLLGGLRSVVLSDTLDRSMIVSMGSLQHLVEVDVSVNYDSIQFLSELLDKGTSIKSLTLRGFWGENCLSDIFITSASLERLLLPFKIDGRRVLQCPNLVEIETPFFVAFPNDDRYCAYRDAIQYCPRLDKITEFHGGRVTRTVQEMCFDSKVQMFCTCGECSTSLRP
jgi:hypothetical protein